MLSDEEIDELLANELVNQLELFRVLDNYGYNNMFNRSIEDSSLPADKKYPPLMTNLRKDDIFKAWMSRNRQDYYVREARDNIRNHVEAFGLLISHENIANKFSLANKIINNW